MVPAFDRLQSNIDSRGWHGKVQWLVCIAAANDRRVGLHQLPQLLVLFFQLAYSLVARPDYTCQLLYLELQLFISFFLNIEMLEKHFGRLSVNVRNRAIRAY